MGQDFEHSELENDLRKLKSAIFPSDWINPSPKESYDLIVIGGGPGGMNAAIAAKNLGATVALIEKEHLGGECLSYGCIPSKAFLRSSRVAHEIRNSSKFGFDVPKDWTINFNAVMHRVRELQTSISQFDSPYNFKKLGIDVFFGEGRFTGPGTLNVKNQSLSFKKALISTGTRPVLPQVPGLDPSDILTNQNIFHITALPSRLGVLGAGPISCELSQAFLRYGSQVTLITHGPRLLSKEDPTACERLKNLLEKEGLKVITQANLIRVEKKGREKVLYFDTYKEPLVVDQLLVAIGRKPAVEGLDLEKAKVTYDGKTGVIVNEYLQTNNPDIYAAGDISSPYKFTHMSAELCTMAAYNALNGNQKSTRSLIIPWCTYTDPEIAHMGMMEAEAKKQGTAYEIAFVELNEIDRAILDQETTGFVKLLVKENQDQILGVTIMAAHAGEMLPAIGVAMQGQNGLTALLKTIHPFPTQVEALRKAANAIIKKRKEVIHV